MNVSPSDAILMAHATFGVLGTLAALWVFVEALNASEANAARTRMTAAFVAIFMAVTCFVGGYWYVRFYPSDRAMILKGPWPSAHNIFMETKEHLFFATLILALYLPFAAGDHVSSNRSARKMVLCVAALIVLTGLAMEGSGAIINHGAKLAFLQAAAGVTP
jgi:hypothetical protein